MTGFTSLLGQAALAIWHDVDPARAAEVDEWHIHEHIPERVAIPGFLRARRYDRLGSPYPRGGKHFTMYETETTDVLTSADYLDRLDNPTPATRRCVPLMERMRRSVYELDATWGQGVGGYASTCQFRAVDGLDQDIRGWLAGLGSLPPGVLAAHLLEPEVAATQAKDSTAEGRITDSVGEDAPWMLMVEGFSEQGLEAMERALELLFWSEAGPKSTPTIDRYRLTVVLTAPQE